ncbi:MAG: ATP-binding cassette domain-containing protein [Candidatus Hodarchaeales archaeon]
MQSHFLKCHDLIKLYSDPVTKIKIAALRGIDLEVEEGGIVALIGPSGAGKSTLINMIGGVEKPSSGDVVVGDKIVNKMKAKELDLYRRQDIGFLYQFPKRNLVWNITAYQNVILPMKLAGRWGLEKQKKRTLELLEILGLDHRAHHKPHQLSGGEAQRLGITIALANDPGIILADEPTGELDSVTTFKIIDYFKKINSKLNKTIIVVTHDHRFANMTDKTMRILDGQIVGLHRSKDPFKERETSSEREELFYIDDFGNLRIPEYLRREADLKKHVKLEMVNGRVTIIPAERPKKK